MRVFLLAMIGGILFISFSPQLPDAVWALLWFPLLLVAWISWRLLPLRWQPLVMGFALGITWGTASGQLMLQKRLPEVLVGEDLLVTGRISDLPIRDERRQRFTLEVESVVNPRTSESIDTDFPYKLQISWYANDIPELRSGEQWQCLVRLKRPRGFANPGGFDYQAWLLRRDVGAVGYVRNSPLNQRLAAAHKLDVGAWRYDLKSWLLSRTQSPEVGVLLALLIGDRSLIEPEQWRLMQATGVNHLISISGLHVGFLALCGFVLGLQLGRCINLVWHRCPALLIAYLCAMVFALFYSALAGFTIPTQRTLMMILVVQLACLGRRSFSIGQVFLLALLTVLVNDPLAAFDLGFWLSFGAVGVLLFYFAGRYSTTVEDTKGLLLWRPLKDLLRSQWAIFIGLFLPMVILLTTTALLAPIANLIAIPLVTFLVVPALLLAAVLHGGLPMISDTLVWLADAGLRFLHQYLAWLHHWADGRLNPVININGWALVLAATGILILLLPKGIPGRWLGYVGLMTALVAPGKPASDLAITVMDVGQGLAVVVQTPHHRLLYDTGPAYSEKFDAGSAIVVPYLWRQGITRLDKLIVSHNDNDHAGGLDGVMQGVQVEQLLVGEQGDLDLVQQKRGSLSCHTFPPWVWDGVSFRFLQTPQTSYTKPNNRSCVLLIEYAGQSILLPGDIEANQEAWLISSQQLPAALTLVLAPHHGSRTSSTSGFVDHAHAQYVIYSAGYRNQHGHPHPTVVARYQHTQTTAFNTAESGALSFVWASGRLQAPLETRHDQRRYWFD